MSHPLRSIGKVFGALPWAVGDARIFTARVLDAWSLHDLTFVAELLVSELMTNAVQHAGGIVDPPDDRDELSGKVPPVLLSMSALDVLRIEVWDQSSTEPIRRAPADDDVGGRGLELVDSLSKEWGCEVLDTGGKIIWCALEMNTSDDAA